MACGDGRYGASGVAPDAKLMPLRLVSGLGSIDEAEAFTWAADNGADVISCSWGPVDGEWWNPDDPTHENIEPLPDSTRLAIDYATETGRGGRGCVITWAAGNGNESVDNDGYAAYERVVAVAACNDSGTRSAYSDMGDGALVRVPVQQRRAVADPGHLDHRPHRRSRATTPATSPSATKPATTRTRSAGPRARAPAWPASPR